jgi:hypothetical protein
MLDYWGSEGGQIMCLSTPRFAFLSSKASHATLSCVANELRSVPPRCPDLPLRGGIYPTALSQLACTYRRR